ncbi:heat shock protein Hsp33 [Limnochorda pilosa]|uniref:33 kDa chaperonin n=1 Tax=Limnochorda pilosa TaxID=1555112 RepID=A0A0K2SL20_LIMPI|nr:heat shock protein Hsp33 [Limnochorda pilosa]
MAAGGEVRVLAAESTVTVNEAQRRHGLLPTATAALGRLMTGAALLGAMLKGQESVTVQVVAGGPLGSLVAVAGSDGTVRGYVGNPAVHLPLNAHHHLDVGGAVGRGDLYVIRDLGLKEPYRGSVPLVSGEIGEDLAYYLAHSEQVPSAVALGVLVEVDASVRAAGGLIVQVLPGHGEETVATVEKALKDLPAISRSIDRGKGPVLLAEERLGSLGLRWLERRPLRFACPCSRERFEEGLVALGREELERLAAEQGEAETVCRFCGTVYRFDATDLRRLIGEATERAPS